MTEKCPKCGKPLRQGARFCGICGYEVSTEQPLQPQAGSPPQQQSSDVCPHCGSKVRPGAKFCNSCGKTIEREKKEEPSLLVEDSGPSTIPEPEKQMSAQEPVSSPPPPPIPPDVSAVKAKPPRRKIWIWLLVVVMVVICGVVIVGTYVYLQDPLGLFAASTQTTSPMPAVTDTLQVVETESESPTLTPIETQLVTPTSEVLPTEIITPTEAVEPTKEPSILFEDDFNGDLTAFWKSWGNPRPKISTGPGDNWLDLSASEDFGSGGVTSREEIISAPGVEIIFKGQLNESYPQYSLLFDWDPLQYDRGPENQDPGIIHLELRRNKLILSTTLTTGHCEKGIEGTRTHTYQLKVLEGQRLELYLDDELLPSCQIADIGLAPVPGKITFTGVGWITNVKVIEP